MRLLVLTFVLGAMAVCALAHHNLTQENTVDVQPLLAAALDGFEVTSWRIELFQDNITSSKACCQCVRHGVKWVIKRAEKRIEKVCEHTKCPVIKRHCEFIRNHKEIGRGMIIAHVHPLCLAHAYCTGRGDCQHKKDLNSYDGELVEAARFGSWMLGDEDLLNIISPRQLTNSSVEESISNSLDKALLDDTPNSSDRCRFCIRLTAHLVMHRALVHIAEHCKHAKGHAKEWCQWASQHHELALGMLLVHIRPGEWGCGFCVGKGLCAEDEMRPLELIKKHPSTLKANIMP